MKKFVLALVALFVVGAFCAEADARCRSRGHIFGQHRLGIFHRGGCR